MHWSREPADFLAEILGELVEPADEVMGRDVVGDAAVVHVGALPCEVGHVGLEVVAEVHEQVDPIRAAAVREGLSGHHGAVLGLTNGIRAAPTEERGQELDHPQVVQPEMKGEERLQILDEHRARDVRLIGEQSQRIVGQQIHLPHAQRREALRLLRIARVDE